MPRRFLLPLLLVSALCPYFIDLDGSSIWDANEAFYVETPREMMERGDYINPTFNYEPRINKPVLSYWIVGAFYQVFGVSIGVQRLPIAIGALVLIASAFFLARAASPDGAPNAAGWWAALGLAISPRLVMFARRIFIDIYLSMFMALMLLFFALAERYPARRRLFLILMYVCVGLGVLTKGPVALVLPALVFGCYLLAHRELGRLREMLIPLGALIMLAIVVPWYAALYAGAGWAPIVSFVLGENVARYTEGLGVNASRGPLFYLPVVFSDAFPWSVFLFVAAAAWVDDRRRRVSDRDAGFRVRTLLWLWILVIVAFFTLSAAKQDLYIFPIVPAIAALAGVTVARGLERESTHAPGITGLRMSAVVIGALLMILGAGLLYLFQTSLAVYTLEGTALAGGIAIAGGACALVLALVKRSREALLAIAAVMIAVNWVFVLRVLPSFEAYKPAPGFATVLQARAGPNDQIVTYNVALPSLVYYLRRHTDVFYDHEPVLPLLESDRTVYLMLPRHDYETIILPAVKARTCIVSRQPMFDVKLKNVLTRERLPELLLVTNKCQ
jgi:4-amino-4-deoxy-L-arabinose transferase-like glycosyltransferase